MPKTKQQYYLEWDDGSVLTEDDLFEDESKTAAPTRLFDSKRAALQKQAQWSKYKNRITVVPYTPVAEYVAAASAATSASDPLNPHHYQWHPALKAAKLQVRDLTAHFNFNLGNVVKYVFRHAHKDGLQDLKKAAEYLQYEIERLQKGA